MRNIKIVTVGGGTGGSVIDEALANKFPDLTAVVTSFDNGGSTGILRREFGQVPQGDIRRRIFAQKTIENKILEEIYNYRFGKNNSLENHSLGNLMILTAQKIWGEKLGLENICKLFKIKGKVLPVTYDYAELAAKLTNGKRLLGEDIVGQSPITLRETEDDRKIEKIYLTRETEINPQVVSEINKADFIILCPGDFYTSLVPNFLVSGFCQAVKKSKAKIILVSNIMTKASETKDFKLSNFVLETEKYLNKKPDYILFNKKKIDKKLIKKYFKTERAVPIENDIKKDARILEVNMLKTNGVIRHDKKLFLQAFEKVLSLESKKNVKKTILENVYIFDLDDTLIETHLHPEWRSGDYRHLKFSKSVLEMLQRVKKENAILLTFDKYGDQQKKLNHLKVEKYFKKVILVDEIIKKKYELNKLKQNHEKSFKDLIVVGDRYEEGELYYAETLGLETICVAFPAGTHRDTKNHHKHLFLIEKAGDFSKLPI